MGQSCFVEGPIRPRPWRGKGQDVCSKWSDIREGLSLQLWQDSHVQLCGLCTARWPNQPQAASRGYSASCSLLTKPCALTRD